MKQIQLIVWSLGGIAILFLIIAIMYFILTQRRKSITWKKLDNLVEDITYKSETLTSTVDTVAKISNYIDIFDGFTRKNIKSLARVVSNNKDDIYKILERIKKLATGENREEKTK